MDGSLASGTIQRIAQVYLFDTCTLRCGYCWLAENGNVLDMRQLERFKDPAFLEQVTSFFLSRTTPLEKWLLLLSGGEPLIAPNLSRLLVPLLDAGNHAGLYTGLMVGRNHPDFRFLLENPYPRTDYVMASMHPESEEEEAEFLEKIRMLKAAGHKVLVRYVAAPRRLHRLNELSERCRELDVAFYPTTLFSRNYPDAYTAEEKEHLSAHFSSLSQHVQLEGGLDTDGLRCHAGCSLISVNLQTGNITPCITVHRPVIGNIFEDRLSLANAPGFCPEPGIACVCDIHFQQDVVPGAAEHSRFVQIAGGFAPPRDYGTELATMRRGGVRFSPHNRIGIGEVRDDSRLFYTNEEVRERYRRTHNRPPHLPFAEGGRRTFRAAHAPRIVQLGGPNLRWDSRADYDRSRPLVVGRVLAAGRRSRARHQCVAADPHHDPGGRGQFRRAEQRWRFLPGPMLPPSGQSGAHGVSEAFQSGQGVQPHCGKLHGRRHSSRNPAPFHRCPANRSLSRRATGLR